VRGQWEQIRKEKSHVFDQMRKYGVNQSAQERVDANKSNVADALDREIIRRVPSSTRNEKIGREIMLD